MAGAYIPEGLWRDKRVSRDAKLLFGILNSHTSQETGRKKAVWPHQDTIAEAMDCTTKSIQRWLKELKETGWISCKRKVIGGLRNGNVYTLHLGNATVELEDDEPENPPTRRHRSRIVQDTDVASQQTEQSPPEDQRRNENDGTVPPGPQADQAEALPAPDEPAQGPSPGDSPEQVPIPLGILGAVPPSAKPPRRPTWEAFETPRKRDAERERQRQACEGRACELCQADLQPDDAGYLKVYSEEVPVMVATGKATRKVVGMRTVVRHAVHLDCLAQQPPNWEPSPPQPEPELPHMPEVPEPAEEKPYRIFGPDQMREAWERFGSQVELETRPFIGQLSRKALSEKRLAVLRRLWEEAA